MYIYTNPNPLGNSTGDCVVRALSVLLDQSWDQTYTELSLTAFQLALMPTNNIVHQEYLRQRGYIMHTVPSICPQCITVAEFAELFPNGKYLLATGDHVVTLINGDYYDIFDSGQEIVAYYFKQSQKKEKGD